MNHRRERFIPAGAKIGGCGVRSRSRETLMELAARWAGLVAPWGAPEDDVARIGSALIGCYAEPHRRYHTVAHLEAVTEALFLDLAADPVSVQLAAFFHDAVYDPRAPRGGNERASVALAEADLRSLGAPRTSTEAVARLIMTTIDHRIEADDADAAVLADADLSILGSPAVMYDAYARAVREEFGWLTVDEWRMGRSAVLRSLLDRRVVYATARGRQRWEAGARANLEAELAGLLAQA
jgi:predicted metal-dependent HD superfamily phosphohydrolase